MPIVGMTTKQRVQFPRLGKLRKGEKKTIATRPGEDIIGAFRFTAEGDDKDIMSAFVEAFGTDRPEEVIAYLLHPAVDDNWECWMEDWVAGGLKHRCDGVNCVVWQDDNGEYHSADKEDAPPCPGGCKPVGRLSLILPELTLAGFVGHVVLETHSKHDIMSIDACLKSIEALTAERGSASVAGIEFRVYRVNETISTPMRDKHTGQVKRVRRSKSLVKITPTPRWVQARLDGAEQQQYAQLTVPTPQIEAPDDEIEAEYEICEETGEIVENETEPDYYAVDIDEARAAMQEVADARGDGDRQSSTNQRQLLAMLISEATGHSGQASDQDRHLFLKRMTGQASSKNITFGTAYGLFSVLLDQDQYPERHVSAHGRRVVMAAIESQMALEGQKPLFEEERE